jgi:hypothetical protein
VIKYGFSDAKVVNIPADPNLLLCWNMDPDTDKQEVFPFQEAIGSLNWAQTGTRPDISYALNAVGQFTKAPEPSHCTAVCKKFRYFKGTSALCISYSKPSSSQEHSHSPIAYCDADFATDISDRKSRTGYVIFLNGGPVI